MIESIYGFHLMISFDDFRSFFAIRWFAYAFSHCVTFSEKQEVLKFSENRKSMMSYYRDFPLSSHHETIA